MANYIKFIISWITFTLYILICFYPIWDCDSKIYIILRLMVQIFMKITIKFCFNNIGTKYYFVVEKILYAWCLLVYLLKVVRRGRRQRNVAWKPTFRARVDDCEVPQTCCILVRFPGTSERGRVCPVQTGVLHAASSISQFLRGISRSGSG